MSLASRVVVIVGLLVQGLALPAHAAPPDCAFVLGFEALHDTIPDVVGECLENVRYDPPVGDAYQMTAAGMLFWRKADNHTAFTDGYRTWVAGPHGVQRRLNSERFLWETVQYLRNAEYRLPLLQEMPVRLADGRYVSQPDWIWAGILDDLVAVGDLDGDGIADAATVAYHSGGGSGTFMYLMLFVARHGELTQVGREFLGDRVRVESVDIADGGLVTVEMIAHGPREPLCCPTQPVTQRFWLRILVDSPQSFAEASLPLRIAGVARTTEGNVRLHIRDARRGVVVDSFTTARMPGVGAFGSFEFVVTDAALASHRNTQVTLELFEESAADGSPVGLASVPIRLR